MFWTVPSCWANWFSCGCMSLNWRCPASSFDTGVSSETLPTFSIWCAWFCQDTSAAAIQLHHCHFVLIVWRLRKCWLDLERFCGSMSCGIQVDKRALAHFLPAGGVHHWPSMGPGFTDSPGCTRKELAWVLWLFSLQQLDVSMFCLILWWHRLSGCCRDRGVWEQSNWPKATVLYFMEVLTEFQWPSHFAQISDGFSSRFGRRRPFVLVGCILYALCLIATWLSTGMRQPILLNETHTFNQPMHTHACIQSGFCRNQCCYNLLDYWGLMQSAYRPVAWEYWRMVWLFLHPVLPHRYVTWQGVMAFWAVLEINVPVLCVQMKLNHEGASCESCWALAISFFGFTGC